MWSTGKCIRDTRWYTGSASQFGFAFLDNLFRESFFSIHSCFRKRVENTCFLTHHILLKTYPMNRRMSRKPNPLNIWKQFYQMNILFRPLTLRKLSRYWDRFFASIGIGFVIFWKTSRITSTPFTPFMLQKRVTAAAAAASAKPNPWIENKT